MQCDDLSGRPNQVARYHLRARARKATHTQPRSALRRQRGQIVDWLRRLIGAPEGPPVCSIAIRVTKEPKDENLATEVGLRRRRWCLRRAGIDLWHSDRCGGRDGQSSNEVRVWLLLCGPRRLAADDVLADQGWPARGQQALRRNVRPGHAGEGGGRGGEEGRED